MAFHLYGLVAVIFVALGQLPDVEARKIVCCLPNAYEISENLLSQNVNDCKRHTIEGQCRYSLDVTAQKSNLNCTLYIDGKLYKFRSLILAKQHKAYYINGRTGKCYPSKINITLLSTCIYSDFGHKLPSFYLGAKPKELNVSAYFYNFFGLSKAFLAYVPGSCTPVETTSYTTSPFFKGSSVNVGLFANYTAGIACPSCAFSVPSQCNTTELASDEDTLFYEKFLFDQQKPPFHWKY